MTLTRAERWHRHNRAVLVAELTRLKRYLRPDADAPEVDGPAAPEDGFVPAIDRLSDAFDLSGFERDAVLLCAGVEADAGFAESCAAAQGNPQWTRPTVGLLLAVLPEASWRSLSPSGVLRGADILRLDKATEFVRAPVSVDEAILHFLLDGDYLDPELDGIAEPLRTAPTSVAEHHAAVARALAFWERASGPLPILHLAARDAGDGLAAAALLCREAGAEPWHVDAASLPTQPAALRKVARHWRRLARLFDAVAVVAVPDETGTEIGETATRFAEAVESPVVLVGRERRGGPLRDLVSLELPNPGIASRRQLWCDALGAALGGPPDPTAVDALATTFELDIAAVRTAAAVAAAPKGAGSGGQRRRVTSAADAWLPTVWGACRERARFRLDQLAQRIDPQTGWDGLVVPRAVEEGLRDLVNQIRHRGQVYEEWKLGKDGARGLGVTALFAGPSGTGKTLAAEVIAGALDLDLYRIDLASVVSKYIGETEKNLARIFDAADAGGVVLLFDEADALFGKRSEVKDSHDRYANIEVGYLLQRMEAYRGLALLTTNLRDSMDQAFQRRLRLVLDFPFPDAALRARLWRVSLPDSVPQKGIDPAALARLPLAGGQIRTVALNAAFLAAADGGVLRPGHLLTAVRREYAKHGRALSDSEARIFE